MEPPQGDETHGVYVVDTAAVIRGTYANMGDICHFRPGLEGDMAMVHVITDAVRAHLDEWIQRNARFDQPTERDEGT